MNKNILKQTALILTPSTAIGTGLGVPYSQLTSQNLELSDENGELKTENTRIKRESEENTHDSEKVIASLNGENTILRSVLRFTLGNKEDPESIFGFMNRFDRLEKQVDKNKNDISENYDEINSLINAGKLIESNIRTEIKKLYEEIDSVSERVDVIEDTPAMIAENGEMINTLQQDQQSTREFLQQLSDKVGEREALYDGDRVTNDHRLKDLETRTLNLEQDSYDTNGDVFVNRDMVTDHEKRITDLEKYKESK